MFKIKEYTVKGNLIMLFKIMKSKRITFSENYSLIFMLKEFSNVSFIKIFTEVNVSPFRNTSIDLRLCVPEFRPDYSFDNNTLSSKSP